MWLRVYSEAYVSGRAPSPHVVPTSLTWRNPPSNPPGSYLSGGGPRRRRRAAAAAAAQGRRGSCGRLAGTAWATRIAGARSPVSARGEVRRASAAGCLGTRHPRSRWGPRASEPGPGTESARVRARPRSTPGCPRKTWLRSPGRPATARLPEAPGRGGGGPACPRSPGKKAEDAGRGAPLLPGPSLRGICSPAQIPAARTAAREGEGARPGRGIFDVSLWEAVDFHMVEGGGRACARSWESGTPVPPRGRRAATRDPGCLRGGSLGDRSPPPPPGPLGDTPRPPLATSARHVLPPRPAPWAPPGLGAGTGGRGWTRRARRLQARAGERGAAGSRGRPGACGPAERGSVGQPRGAPLPGVGRRGDGAGGIRAPRRRAGWAGRGDRLVRMAGRDEPPWEGPVTPRRKRGPGPCPPGVPSAGPREPRGLGGRPGRPGWAAGRRRWPGAFQE